MAEPLEMPSLGAGNVELCDRMADVKDEVLFYGAISHLSLFFQSLEPACFNWCVLSTL